MKDPSSPSSSVEFSRNCFLVIWENTTWQCPIAYLSLGAHLHEPLVLFLDLGGAEWGFLPECGQHCPLLRLLSALFTRHPVAEVSVVRFFKILAQSASLPLPGGRQLPSERRGVALQKTIPQNVSRVEGDPTKFHRMLTFWLWHHGRTALAIINLFCWVNINRYLSVPCYVSEIYFGYSGFVIGDKILLQCSGAERFMVLGLESD